ncbi:hypothetical protein [Polaribacter porphyrae]|uniref:Uncharacterized protein n=1 Tax=Polaribacter porphyrae TaxID=1137780 RepID=A0A2S7WN10_9FLAO|nr:hypothetical protein [Polaribacter porphyrae]PQJ78994.1 hypothetical protein BTO18_07315 [Polaribacter porphyrae]
MRGIDKEELVLLKFSEEEAMKELKWKHSKEFEYKGEMYDIVKTEKIGNIIHYWCWWDHEETRLNRELTELVTNLFNDSPQKAQKENQLISFYNSLYYNDINSSSLSTRFVKYALIFHYSESYLSIILKPTLPPPKC